uniref:Ig-like domain-containing protein n=1 Tax=Steinernema glaseri TaxID=37863 RepID=A0A1I7ZUZ2_9BILA
MTSGKSHARRHSKSDYPILEGMYDHYGGHADFTLKCPHVGLGKTLSSSLEVTWSHNNRQQVTVTHGVPYVNPQLPISSIKSKRFKNKTILHVGTDDDHREFQYNELREKFTLRIAHLLPKDFGIWECKIVMDERGKKKTYTSRKQAKVHKTTSAVRPTPTVKPIEAVTILTRGHERSIEINRQSFSRESNIVFSRQNTELSSRGEEKGRRVLIDRSSDGRRRHAVTHRFGVIDRIQRFVKFVLEARASSASLTLSVHLLVACILYCAF